jgi:GAF domain-containing protein
VASDATAEPVVRAGRSAAVPQHLVVPVILHGRVFGVLQATAGRDRRFTRHDARLLRAFADQVSIAVHTARVGPERRS